MIIIHQALISIQQSTMISNQSHFSEYFKHHQRSDQNLNAIGNDGFADQRVTDSNFNFKTDKTTSETS